ncbi:uncharacterized protein LOC123558034 [Mercenaria mercenaria]|uniref:uncharacterized protein LOC123558034 n=1 Tax=Mercenaria mercenaria TaxID=6596 RepID=UPI00234EAAD2|nr:uncharacterized protein LOC123558034 [Mercenaria mercenaria]
MKERVYYHSKREQSRVDPKKFLSMKVDGMDQSKTNLPHFKGRLPKSINAADLLKTHITGVISHGHGGFHTFTDFSQYPHDPNLTINVILMMLGRTAQQNDGVLPPVLYIQADNCARENKNRYVLAFLQLLVEKKIFNEVHLSCLPVGHTHEDIDARFSLIARRLYQNDVETFEDFLRILDLPKVIHTIYDVKSWLMPCLPDYISGTSEPLHYKFERIDNVVTCFYKGNKDSEWKATELGFLVEMPRSKPKIIKPDFNKIEEEKLFKLIENNKSLFKTTNILEHWKTFIKELKRKQINEKWILPDLPTQTDRMPLPEEPLPDDLVHLLEKENREPQVNIRLKKTRKRKNINRQRPRNRQQNSKTKKSHF